MNLIDKANETLKSNSHKYKYHLAPNSGWSNDPNGLIYYKGSYHVFMQNDPFSTTANKIFWGHFVSKDLVHWQQVKFALAPDQNYDRDGCYSGSAIVFQNKLFLFYAGHRNEKNTYVESICVAESQDGINFTKSKNNPIISRDSTINTKRFRDPKIIFKNNYFYIIVGGESTDQIGQLLLYQGNNIYGPWKYLKRISNKRSEQGNMLECPDYFDISGKHILLCSPKGMKTSEKHGFGSFYYFNNFKFNNEFLPTPQNLDYGYDFYAPQTLFDPVKKRRLLIGWSGLPTEQEKERQNNFISIGALTLLRDLTIKNEKLFQKPVNEYKKLRYNKKEFTAETSICTNFSEFTFKQVPSEFNFELSSNSASYKLKVENNILFLKVKDRIRKHNQKINDLKKISNLDLYIDKDLIELYLNDGEFVFTSKCEFESSKIKVDFDSKDKVVGFSYQINSIYR